MSTATCMTGWALVILCSLYFITLILTDNDEED